MRRHIARFSGVRTRQGATENCIIGMSAWTCAARTISSWSIAARFRNERYSPPPIRSGQANGYRMSPRFTIPGTSFRRSSQLCSLSRSRCASGCPHLPAGAVLVEREVEADPGEGLGVPVRRGRGLESDRAGEHRRLGVVLGVAAVELEAVDP